MKKTALVLAMILVFSCLAAVTASAVDYTDQKTIQYPTWTSGYSMSRSSPSIAGNTAFYMYYGPGTIFDLTWSSTRVSIPSGYSAPYAYAKINGANGGVGTSSSYTVSGGYVDSGSARVSGFHGNGSKAQHNGCRAATIGGVYTSDTWLIYVTP